MKPNNLTLLAGTILAAVLGTPASAGGIPATQPELTTAVFGDWILRCQPLADGKRACEAATVITPQGQASPVAQLVIARGTAGANLRIAVLLPANITFAAAPVLAAAKQDRALVTFSWVNCTPGACLAAAELAPDTLSTLIGLQEPGRVAFRDSTGRQIYVVIPFRGLSQAAAALSDT